MKPVIEVSGSTGSTGQRRSAHRPAVSFRWALAGLSIALSAPVWAGPAGGQVVAGQATITQSATSTVINQASANTAINWQSFSIPVGETVQFVQPSTSSVALNRVLGPDASSIFGALSANGQVFLLNPNGVLFGPGAQVSVGGLVATTLNLSDADFLAGNMRFTASTPAGTATVVNQGSINADGGYVVLIASQVLNQGVIGVAGGSVALAAGAQVTLAFSGLALTGLVVDVGAVAARVDNKGSITVDGGQALLYAKAADQLIQSVVNNEGLIRAGTLSNVGGKIRLEADVVVNSNTGVLIADGGLVINTSPGGGPIGGAGGGGIGIIGTPVVTTPPIAPQTITPIVIAASASSGSLSLAPPTTGQAMSADGRGSQAGAIGVASNGGVRIQVAKSRQDGVNLSDSLAN